MKRGLTRRSMTFPGYSRSKDFVQRILKKDIALYERALYHLRQRDDFSAACDQFSAEQVALKAAAGEKRWMI